MMHDFRYGPNRTIRKPRLAQTYYAFGQMRNLARSAGRQMAFWFGTYNDEWFALDEQQRDRPWQERAMCYTAIGQGADLLVAGFGVPEERAHWDSLGEGLRVVQKAGPELAQSRRLRSRAAFLFPRTQYLQLQEEYWNVAGSYELFRRAFGDVDVIHEEQVLAGELANYRALAMFDVKLLPKAAAEKIVEFVRAGGTVIADCVPALDEFQLPQTLLAEMFAVRDPRSNRIQLQQGDNADAETPQARLAGRVLGIDLDLLLVSPRAATPAGATVLLRSSDGLAALTSSAVGRGRAWLLGFCVQDTVFETWRSGDADARRQLHDMIRTIMDESAVVSQVRCSDPDVEASVRSDGETGFLIIAAHETEQRRASIELMDLPMPVNRVIDIETDRDVSFRRVKGGIVIDLSTPPGKTYLLKLGPG